MKKYISFHIGDTEGQWRVGQVELSKESMRFKVVFEVISNTFGNDIFIDNIADTIQGKLLNILFIFMSCKMLFYIHLYFN